MLNIKELLDFCIEREASDIHLTVGVPPILRIDGNLKRMGQYESLISSETEALAYELFDEQHKKIFEKDGEVDFSHSIESAGRFRINVYRQRGSIGIALRFVAPGVPTIDDLGLPQSLKKLALRPRGLVLVTGQTGSGKSTTLAAMIKHINKNRNAHIITLEDPIEYLHEHGMSVVNQREIGHDTKSYGKALRAALRQDPDVILIGEMRDLETISTAVTAAETGHLVLSTLHTIGAVHTINRIIDVFPVAQQQQIRIQLSTVLEGVISQQLVRRDSEKGGRVAALEIMLCNSAIKNYIRDAKTHQIMSSIQTGRKAGMISMDTYLAALYRKKLISHKNALAYCVNPDTFEETIKNYDR
ncbi:MAG: type IV pilus twitching motility protein PilT [Pseudomonadota bacterium]